MTPAGRSYYERSPDRTLPIVRFAALFALFLACLVTPSEQIYAEEQEAPVTDPCAGPSALLAIVGRPTASDSPCAVPSGRLVIEMGFQRANLRGPGNGTADNYPQAVVRFGLPGRNELVLLTPSYNRQRTHVASAEPAEESSGYSALTVGFKHELGYTRSWLGAMEVLFTLPSGAADFGSRGLGVALNGIASSALTEQVGLALQLGASSQTEPKSSGGRRFTSLISNLVATWQPTERLQFFGEIFGQTSTGPGEGVGYNADGGIQCLITPSWVIDLEAGVRLTGNLGGFTHYYGVGMAFRF